MLERLGPATEPVRDRLRASAPAETALWLLAMPADAAATLAAATVADATTALDRCTSPEDRAELVSTVEIGRSFPGDVGVVVALLLNHVVLAPGQAIFLGAGNVHAYLGGVAVEVMANSDNVIRGGLTTKHIDVAELGEIVDRRWGPVAVQHPTGPIHTFESPVPDFALTRLDATTEAIEEIEATPSGPEIVLVTSGSLTVHGGSAAIELGPGQAAFVAPAAGPCRLRVADGTLAWRVTIG